jgi:ribonucleoside-diphosphate reductase alpha chain
MTPANNSWLTTPIARHIWETKYRWQEGGRVQESSIEDTWHRVAHAMAIVEPAGHGQWEERFFDVMGLIEDDMESIYRHGAD